MNTLPPPGEDDRDPGEGPDGSRPLSEQLPELPVDIVVPDDISALHAEVQAWRREQAALRRKGRLDRLLLSRRRHSYGISGAMVLVALCFVAGIGLLLVALGPRAGVDNGGQATALATPTASPGALHGLLPDIALTRLDDTAVGSRELDRPAALVLVPGDCACSAAVHHAIVAAQQDALHAYVVTSALTDLHRYTDPDASIADGILDIHAQLASTYGTLAGSPTVVALRSDGTVSAVQVGVSPMTSLEAVLTSAAQTTGAGSGAGSGGTVGGPTGSATNRPIG